MITFDIPENKIIEAEHLVLDFNGTLAIDGCLIDGVRPLLELLAEQITIHIVTADTFGSVRSQMQGINCSIHILDSSSQDMQKKAFVEKLGCDKVVAIGNGRNDLYMLSYVALSVFVVQQEGAYAPLSNIAAIVCFSVVDALNLLINPLRVVATLRN